MSNNLTPLQEMMVAELLADIRFMTGRSGYPLTIVDVLNDPKSPLSKLPDVISVLGGFSVIDPTAMVPTFAIVKEKEVCGRMVFSVRFVSTERPKDEGTEVLYLRRYNHESIMAERPHFFLAPDITGWILTEDLPPKHYHQGF